MFPTVITTGNLILRTPCLADADAFFAALSDFEVTRMTGAVPWPYSRSDAENFIRACLANRETGAAHVLTITSSGEPAFGTAGLSHVEDGVHELGFWLARTHWGNGYATEAARAVIDWARASLPVTGFIAGHYTDNPASGRILEKLGFRSVGEVDMPSRARGSLSPSRQYVLDAPADLALKRDHCGHQ